MIDATLYIASDGSSWMESHWMEPLNLDGPAPKYRIVEIKDGTNEHRPLICWVEPDRRPA